MSTAAKEKTEKKSLAKGFQPLGDRVFVTYNEEMDRTSGGIYVPDSAKEKPQRGIVQAIGKKYFAPEQQSIVVVGDAAVVAQLKDYGAFATLKQ